ncbi:MAG: hypothetical protein KAU22_01735, partial [Desulfuromonadales bacterium]|nr:hypothetical protein [Desulfuromonadales bacterium]
LQMPYSAIIEGRTISGRNVNPPNELLAGPLFWGSQSHETDGAFYYWGNGSWWEWPFSDVLAKFRLYVRGRPIHTKEGSFLHFNPYVFDNMEEGRQNFVNNIAKGKGASVRHTGPTTLFRYFLQAGYEWVGAELMYGPEEVTMSALRGANRAYGKRDYGTHLATQWSSVPFDVSEHSTRLFLSLAISYIHGASHINTEDALWSTEWGIDRYSETGQEHILQHRNIFRFIQTHERRGKLVAPVAILQGRNDAWKCFLRGNVWSGMGDQWKFGPAEESMDLINVFYPGSKLDAIYKFPCPNEPVGWYTSTPYGPIDLTPIEAGSEVLDSYKAVALLGWNTYKKEDFEKLLNYTKNGGKLLLTHAHINTELKHDKPVTLPDDDDV